MEPSNKPTGPHELELTPSAPPSPSATTSTSNSIRSPSPTLPTSDRKPSSRRGPASFPADPRPWPTRSWAYQYRPFRGMWADVKRRLPYYCSDWTEAVLPKNMQRTVGTTIRIYFLNVMPALAYTLDMNFRTGGSYGVNETLLSSALAALVFGILSVQPLTIVGVTGLISLFNFTTYDILESANFFGDALPAQRITDYLQFQAWVLIWSAITHFIVAVCNVCDGTRFITDMTSETFGFYVGVIYLQKGMELLIEEFTFSGSAGYYSIVIAMLFVLSVYFFERTATLGFGPFWARKFLADYSFALAIVFFTGFVHIPGNLKDTALEFLPITKAFAPSTDRNWVVDFWNLDVKWIFVAFPFGCLVTLLFYFDNNVSSVMAQSRGFPVKRPAGFHWDFFLLGCTTLVAGILGLPAPNGLVPQAPIHTESLCVTEQVPDESKVGGRPMKVVRTRLVEQRVSHTVMGLLALGTMARPLLVVLGLQSRAMFAGVFLSVGWGSIEGNGIAHKALFLLRDSNLTPPEHPLLQVRKQSIAKFIGIQLAFFAGMMAVSETLAGIGFPVIITLLIPVRHYWLPRIFSATELAVLDAPTANSAAVLVSIGGPLQPERGAEVEVDLGKSTAREEEEGSMRRRGGPGKEGEAVLEGEREKDEAGV